MKKLLSSFLFIFPLIALSQAPEKELPGLAPMLKKTTPAVVNIMVERKTTLSPAEEDDTSPPSLKSQPDDAIAVGSGVIIDAKNGLIVTNAHVINHEKLMVVTLKDGRRFHASLVGKDDGFDIAIIHVTAKNLTAIPFGNSDKLEVGNFVATIGSPFGLTQTVTSGVISALNRSEPKIEGYQSFIQTDAPINPGNSGGALVNLQGQLVGMNTAILTANNGSIGIGFAIPSNMVKSVVTQLVKYGKVERGMLGVVAQNISLPLATALKLQPDQGVLVTTVVPGSPADTAKIKMKDVILKVNGEEIHTSVQLRNMLGMMRPGTPLMITLVRNHETKNVKTEVGNPKRIAQQKEIPFISGMRLQDFSELEADGTKTEGVLITWVSPQSQGLLAGLMPGDIITSVNDKSIHTVNELKTYAAKNTNELLVTVKRNANNLFVVIEP